MNLVLHRTIKAVDQDLNTFSFNTAIARLMELTNALYKYTDEEYNVSFARSCIRTLLKLLAPFAPHFSEELWEQIGEDYSIFNQDFPTYEEKYLVEDEITYPLQINGRVKDRFSISKDATKEEIEEYVMKNFSDVFSGFDIVKKVIVPGRIVNIVVKPKQ